MPRFISFLAPASLACLLVTALSTSGCCRDPVDGGRYFCLSEMSDTEEAQLGEEFAPSFVAQNGGVYPDPALHAYLNSIVIDQMAKKSHRPQLPWSFTILNTAEWNAFALPGGKVFVTRGLLATLESEAQFAHLMGHEIGHVSHRHAMRGQGRGAVVGLIVGVIGLAESVIPTRGPDDPLWISSTVGAVGSLANLKFSRDQELESDERGVDYAVAAGYDPREGAKTFERFLAAKQDAGSGENRIAGLFSTHPLDSDRIHALGRYIEKRYPGIADRRPVPTVSRPKFGEHSARLKAADEVYQKDDRALALVARSRKEKNQRHLDDAEQLARECVAALPDHAHFHVTLGLISVERSSTTDALRHLDRAVGIDPALFDARLLRGIVRWQAKQLEPAGADLESAKALFPASPLPHYLLGRVREEAGDKQAAAAHYQQAIEKSPRGGELRDEARARMKSL